MSGWGEFYPIFFGFLEFFNFAKPLIRDYVKFFLIIVQLPNINSFRAAV